MFQSKTVLVTGSARNTGTGIARVFGHYGAVVYVHGRDLAKVEALVDSLNDDPANGPGRYRAVAGDVSSEDDVARIFNTIAADTGGLDVLVNNACHLGMSPGILDMPISLLDDVLAVNLRGYTLCAQYAGRQMRDRQGGAIVNIGSNTAQHAILDRVAYIASKGGIESLTRALAIDLAPHRIRVNAVIPGYIHTERWGELPAETIARRRANVPLGKEATGEDVGEAAAFLASNKARNITGASLLVSGGIDAQLVPPDVNI